MKYYSSITKKTITAVLVASFFLPGTLFAYAASPVAITQNATYITEKSVRLNGRVNPNDMPDIKQWFEWGVSGQYQTVYETPHNGMWAQSTLADTSADLVGLAPGTQYFYRQIAENGRGKDIGQTVYFTTKPLPVETDPPVIVQTIDPARITDGSAVLRGYVSPHGDGQASFWFEWGTSMKFEDETPHQGHGGDSGTIEVSVSNLLPGTSYFFRVVGENSQGRVYGATRMFVTTGIPPPPPEAPKDQTIAAPVQSTDTTVRKVTVSGDTGVTGGGVSSLPGTSGRPGDFFNFSALFGGKKTNTTQTQGTQSATEGGSSATNQTAAVASASGPFGTFWNNLTGKKAVEVTLENVGPKDVPIHSPVEYRVTYHYRSNDVATGAKLKFTLPGDVVYIGDTTNNELLLEESAGPERTYILPIGRLESGSTRTVSILGMTTGSAKGFPVARARMEYIDASGNLQVVAANGGVATANNTANAQDSGGFLPSSFFGWMMYVLVIVLSVIGIRKAKAYYAERKKEIEAERSASNEPVAYPGSGRMSQGV